MKLTNEEKQIIEKIQTLFEQSEKLFNTLSNEAQDKILDYHDENYSLNHCIRWGLQACEDLEDVLPSD